MHQPQNLIEQLRHISKDILIPGDFHDKLAPAITAYTKLLFNLGQIKPDSMVDRQHINLEFGNAIGSFWAANCVKEVFRTQRFVRGLCAAVQDKLEQKSGPIHILYAGTGPFATLALPIMTQFSPEEIQFTFLEINENSYNKLHDVISAFDLHKYVKRFEIADATGYVLEDLDIDIVLSETMNRALITEPQVFIMLNIASQLDDKVIYLPEEITVNLCAKKRNENIPNDISTLINFNLAEMKSIISNSNKNQWVFDEVKVEVGDNALEDLYYSTEVKVYRDNYLSFNDSSLNLLEKVKLDQKGAKNLFFKYSANDRPGFKASTESMAKT